MGSTPLPSDEESDEDLVRHVRSGDEAAARLLFERHLPAMRAKAKARLPIALRGKVAESDVIQEAYLAAFLAIGEFEDRGEGAFGAWVRKILDRKILDEVRRHIDADKRDAQRQVRLATEAERLAPARDGLSPSGEAADAEESARLRAVVESLPEDYATVMRLVHEQGLSVADAAATMDRSAEATRKLYRRALARLAHRLGPQPGADA